MNRNRLVATLLSGLITIGILGLPTHAFAAQSPQAAAPVSSITEVANLSTSVENKTVASDTSVTVTPYPSPYGSLSGISQAFYGDISHWPGLCSSNGIANCDLLYVGQSIRVPTTAPVGPAPAPAPAQAPANNSSRAQRIVNYALAQVGKPYVWAAAGPYAFDCSGLVMRALEQVGVYVPHQDQSILYSGQGYAVSRDNLQPGDIVWPYNGHVFVYIGNGKIVEAANPAQGVIVNNLYSFMAARRYV